MPPHRGKTFRASLWAQRLGAVLFGEPLLAACVDVEACAGGVRGEAPARLLCYETEVGHVGLMAPDGHVVTKPLYRSIEAIGADLYLCQVGDTEFVVVNSKGEESR